MDLYDCKGQNPYQVKEILKDKVWRVSYKLEQFMFTRPKAKEQFKMLGLDPTDADYQSKVIWAANDNYGREKINVITVVKKDLETCKALYEKKEFSKEEIFDLIPPWKLNMIVVKLDSGGVLLYAPVKIHKEAKELLYSWLESIGPVEYVVVASSAHTLFLPDVVETFPEAKIIGPKFAEEKLKHIKVIEKFDYVTTNEEELKNLNKELEKDGLNIYNIDGDVAANAVVCLVNNQVLLECDILYGHHDGHGLLDLDEAALRQWRTEDFMTRLFKMRLLTKPNSPNGFLPNYRFWCMDPGSLGALMYEPPAKDGSTRKTMAASLRNVLNLQYDTALGVHFDKMTKDEFQNSINSAWNWLDGKSLK